MEVMFLIDLFNALQHSSSSLLHFLYSAFQFVGSNVAALLIHGRFDAHDAQQRRNHRRLTKDTSVQNFQLHLRSIHHFFSKNSKDRRNANPQNDFERIRLHVIGDLMVGRQRISVNQSHVSLLKNGLFVQIV
mmetsp:Transcript_55028/g.159318  ORF Transcript_55028/g.159318 Transcript_55028/m.159318 type:complete len:132 (+) Transcript_55028:132-527(+)